MEEFGSNMAVFIYREKRRKLKNHEDGELKMYLRVWDKTREKDGNNKAIYELHTQIKANYPDMKFWAGVIERILNNIEPDRFTVLLEDEKKELAKPT